MLNLSSIIETHAHLRKDKTAVVMGTTRLSYGRLNAMANMIANGLVAAGIQPGDKVALGCPNLPYFPAIYYGILKTGAVVVPLNVLLKPREIAYHLKDSDARLYFCFEGNEALPMGQMGAAGAQEAGVMDFFVITADPAAAGPVPGARTLGMLMKDRAPTFDTVQRSETDTAVILYTSGTTGQAKGAELTHSNMLWNAKISCDLHNLGGLPDPKCLIVLPLFHSFGQTCQMNAMLSLGGTCVMLPRFDAKVALETLAAEKVNVFSGVPTMYWAMLNHAKQQDFDLSTITANLKLCSSGGAAMPVELLGQLDAALPGVSILEGYGLSETSPVASFNQIGFPRKPGSIGLVIQGVEMKIVDDNGKELPRGELGEIVIRGHNVMKGYYKKPEATAAAIRNGWFHSGDLGKQDDDGYFFILDRKKDMVIRGGFNVYPREIEEVLATHPAVSMTAVVGVPHPEHGEEVKAFVIRKPGASITEIELMAWCKDTMAAYKYPRIIEFRDALPMNATGKILKRELRG